MKKLQKGQGLEINVGAIRKEIRELIDLNELREELKEMLTRLLIPSTHDLIRASSKKTSENIVPLLLAGFVVPQGKYASPRSLISFLDIFGIEHTNLDDRAPQLLKYYSSSRKPFFRVALKSGTALTRVLCTPPEKRVTSKHAASIFHNYYRITGTGLIKLQHSLVSLTEREVVKEVVFGSGYFDIEKLVSSHLRKMWQEKGRENARNQSDHIYMSLYIPPKYRDIYMAGYREGEV